MDTVKGNGDIPKQRNRLLTNSSRPAREHHQDLDKHYLMSDGVTLQLRSCQLVVFRSHVAHRCGFVLFYFPPYIFFQIELVYSIKKSGYFSKIVTKEFVLFQKKKKKRKS